MRRLLSAVAVAGLLGLAGCSSGSSDQPAAASSTAVDPHDHAHVEALPSTAPASPTWGERDTASATQVGLDAMRAFAQPDLDPEVWYELLAGYLTAAGQQAFYGVDPSTVPVRVVLGTSSRPGPSPYLAEVTAFTDAGDYRLQLVRDGVGDSWKVERLEPAR